MKFLGNRIRETRVEKRLNQKQLSDLVEGLEQQVLTKIENRPNKNSKYATAIANALGVKLRWLLTGEGNKDNTLAANATIGMRVSAKLHTGLPSGVHAVFDPDAVRFSLMHYESVLTDPDLKDLLGDRGFSARVFTLCYYAFFDEDTKKLPTKALLRLVE